MTRPRLLPVRLDLSVLTGEQHPRPRVAPLPDLTYTGLLAELELTDSESDIEAGERDGGGGR